MKKFVALLLGFALFTGLTVNDALAGKPFKAPIPISLPVAQTGTITFSNAVSHISDIPETAWQSVQNVITNNKSVPKVNNVVHMGPNTTLDVGGGMPRIQTILSRGEKLWVGFSQVKNFYLLMYNAKDEPWAQSDWSATGKAAKFSAGDIKGEIARIAGNCQQTNSPGNFSGAPTNCRGADSSAISNSDNAVLTFGQGGQGAANDPYVTSGGIVGHEYTHSVQAAQWIGNPSTYCTERTNSPACFRSYRSNTFAPCWLIEGQPNSVGPMVAADTFEAYKTFHQNIPFGQGPSSVTDYSQASLLSYLTSQKPGQSTSPNGCISNGNVYRLGYTVGALVVETLVAIAGPQATMALEALGASGQDFPTAFKNVYGISWADAAVILSKVLAAEYATYGPPPQ
jgi:hypothetical protein